MNGTMRQVRWLSLFAAGAALALAGVIGTAAAEGVSGTLSSTGHGQQIAVDGGQQAWAGLLHLSVDGGGGVETYCIDLGTSTSMGVHYQEGSWSDANVTNLGKVTWVLRHGYPNVSPTSLATAAGLGGLTADQAAAATQAAIWHFSDGTSLDVGNSAAIVATYQYLVNNATATAEPGATLSVTPAALSGTVGELIGPFTVHTSATMVQLTASGGVISDGAGNVLTTAIDGDTFYLTIATPGSVTVEATASATLSSGRVFMTTHSSPKQKLIVAASTVSTANATASVSAADTTTTTEAVTTTTEAVTTTTEAVTTTTEAVTTTTEAATTTTEVATTTTAVATTTTEVGSEGPTTTVAATTTTSVASGGPTTTVRALPHTGQPAGRTPSLLLTGAGFTLMGLALVFETRRRVA